jgi:hypothetical protein
MSLKRDRNTSMLLYAKPEHINIVETRPEHVHVVVRETGTRQCRCTRNWNTSMLSFTKPEHINVVVYKKQNTSMSLYAKLEHIVVVTRDRNMSLSLHKTGTRRSHETGTRRCRAKVLLSQNQEANSIQGLKFTDVHLFRFVTPLDKKTP